MKRVILFAGLIALVVIAGSGCGLREDRKATANDGLSGLVVDSIRRVKITASKSAFDPNHVYIRKGDEARIQVVSIDADGRFVIPNLNIDSKVVSGKTTLVDLTPGEWGDFTYYLKAGAGSPEVKGTLTVVP